MLEIIWQLDEMQTTKQQEFSLPNLTLCKAWTMKTYNFYSAHEIRTISELFFNNSDFFSKDKAKSICHLLKSTGHAMYITNRCGRRVKYDIKTILAKVHQNNSNKLMCNSRVITLTQWRTPIPTQWLSTVWAISTKKRHLFHKRFLLQYNHACGVDTFTVNITYINYSEVGHWQQVISLLHLVQRLCIFVTVWT